MQRTKRAHTGHLNLTPSLGLAVAGDAQARSPLDSKPFATTGLGCDLKMEFRLGNETFRVFLNTVKGVPEVRQVTVTGDAAGTYHDIARAIIAAKQHLEEIIASEAFNPPRRLHRATRVDRGPTKRHRRSVVE